MRENWWKFLVLALVVGGLVWWRQQEPQESVLDLPTEEEALEDTVDTFLRDRGLVLPEDSDRANLADQANSGATGVAVRKQEATGTEVTVMAALPDLTDGVYVAWVRQDDGKYLKLGTLRASKGGWLLDYSGKAELMSEEVVVSREDSSQVTTPDEIMLKGTFPQTEQ